jgi:hypothetical protein
MRLPNVRAGLPAHIQALVVLSCRAALLAAVLAGPVLWASASGRERVRVNADETGFVLAESGRPFLIWAVNYDRDYRLRLTRIARQTVKKWSEG